MTRPRDKKKVIMKEGWRERERERERDREREKKKKRKRKREIESEKKGLSVINGGSNFNLGEC